MKDRQRTKEQLVVESNMAGEASSPLSFHYDMGREY